MVCVRCEREDVKIHVKSLGLCSACYYHWLKENKNYKPKTPKDRPSIICSFCGEEKPHKSKGLCGACYKRLLTKGTPEYDHLQKDDLCTFCGKYNIKAKGLCQACYTRYLKKGTAEYNDRSRGVCSIEGCGRPHCAKGYCQLHYSRYCITGNPNKTLRDNDWGKRVKHPLYRLWGGMKKRCYDPDDSNYSNYGGRGIKICDRWLEDFLNFVEDMGRRPSPNHSIDRKNNDGDYTPENCRWATAKEQAANKRNNVLNPEIAFEIRRLNLNGSNTSEIAKMLNISYDSAYSVLRYNTF